MVNIRARLCAATAVDENGNRLFSEKDVELLGKKSSAALDRCVKVAQKLNRLTETELDDLTKN
jgi:DNA-binding transcriptional MerR regulator